MRTATFVIQTDGTEKVLTINLDNWSEERLFNFFKDECPGVFWDCDFHESFNCSVTELADDIFELSASGDNGALLLLNAQTFTL